MYIFVQSQIQSFEAQHGSLLGLGYIIGRYLSRNQRQDSVMIIDGVQTAAQLNNAITEAVKIIGNLD